MTKLTSNRNREDKGKKHPTNSTNSPVFLTTTQNTQHMSADAVRTPLSKPDQTEKQESD